MQSQFNHHTLPVTSLRRHGTPLIDGSLKITFIVPLLQLSFVKLFIINKILDFFSNYSKYEAYAHSKLFDVMLTMGQVIKSIFLTQVFLDPIFGMGCLLRFWAFLDQHKL